MRPRLSFANLVSVLALFIALGGTSYAVVKINGSQIKDRSIPAGKIKKGSLTATEVKSAALADRTKQLVVSKPRKQSAKARDAAVGTTTPPPLSSNPSLVELQVGQTAPLVQVGPLGYEVSCTDQGFGPLVTIRATSQEAGALVDWGFVSGRSLIPAEVNPGTPVVIVPPAGDHFAKVIQGRDMIAPSGATLHVGAMIYGTNLYGSPCVASAFAVG